MRHFFRVWLLLLSSFVLFPVTTAAENAPADVLSNTETQTSYLREVIIDHFPDPSVAAIMIAIAACESNGEPDGNIIHWTSSGALLPNKEGSSARGMFQVLMGLHRPEMEARGLTPEHLDEYMQYVQYLYERNNGFHDWYESRSCWGNVQLAQN